VRPPPSGVDPSTSCVGASESRNLWQRSVATSCSVRRRATPFDRYRSHPPSWSCWPGTWRTCRAIRTPSYSRQAEGGHSATPDSAQPSGFLARQARGASRWDARTPTLCRSSHDPRWMESKGGAADSWARYGWLHHDRVRAHVRRSRRAGRRAGRSLSRTFCGLWGLLGGPKTGHLRCTVVAPGARLELATYGLTVRAHVCRVIPRRAVTCRSVRATRAKASDVG
jgi:hypothetical protein